jgi:hypothetical protein
MTRLQDVSCHKMSCDLVWSIMIRRMDGIRDRILFREERGRAPMLSPITCQSERSLGDRVDPRSALRGSYLVSTQTSVPDRQAGESQISTQPPVFLLLPLSEQEANRLNRFSRSSTNPLIGAVYEAPWVPGCKLVRLVVSPCVSLHFGGSKTCAKGPGSGPCGKGRGRSETRR